MITCLLFWTKLSCDDTADSCCTGRSRCDKSFKKKRKSKKFAIVPFEILYISNYQELLIWCFYFHMYVLSFTTSKRYYIDVCIKLNQFPFKMGLSDLVTSNDVVFNKWIPFSFEWCGGLWYISTMLNEMCYGHRICVIFQTYIDLQGNVGCILKRPYLYWCNTRQ